MANLGTKNGVYIARFRFCGKEYKRSLKTTVRKAAEGVLHRIEDALHRLAMHLITVPPGVDPGDFVLSGGTLIAPGSQPRDRPVRTPAQAVPEYLECLGHLAPSNRCTIGSHLRSLLRLLGPKAERPLDRIEPRDLEEFLQARLREGCHTTVSKVRHSVVQMFAWTVTQGYLENSPARCLTKIKASGDPSPFRTVQEIEAILLRGDLGAEEILSAWDCLYLAPAEIADLLATVRQRSHDEVSYLLHAIPAYTGMRRGEVLRLRWIDIELDQDAMVARSRKQSRQSVETRRRIDLHPELKQSLLEWQHKRPRGQFVICEENGVGPLTTWRANTLFRQPLRRTTWCLCSAKDWFKIGFHTYRHSFASNLAAAGVDQRVIDEFMGHTTEAMRKRYRHLFPRDRRSAIESFSLAVSSSRREEGCDA
jgi:integrase